MGGMGGMGGMFAIKAEAIGGNAWYRLHPRHKIPTKPGPVTTPPPVALSVASRPMPGGSASCPVDLPVMPTQQLGAMFAFPWASR